AMSRIQDQSTSNPTSFAQQGAVAALEGPQECVAQMREAFERRRDNIVARLRAMPGIECVQPEGAFYVLPNVSCLLSERVPDSGPLADALLNENHTAVVPGSGFGMPNPLRLSYATSDALIGKGMDRLEAAARRLTGK